jgi:hypothetical protein
MLTKRKPLAFGRRVTLDSVRFLLTSGLTDVLSTTQAPRVPDLLGAVQLTHAPGKIFDVFHLALARIRFRNAVLLSAPRSRSSQQFYGPLVVQR